MTLHGLYLCGNAFVYKVSVCVRNNFKKRDHEFKRETKEVGERKGKGEHDVIT